MAAFLAPTSIIVPRKRALKRASVTCSLTAPAAAAAAAKGPELAVGYKHFLHVDDLSSDEVQDVLQGAVNMKKRGSLQNEKFKPLENKMMSMVFAKPSARTRVSFESAMFYMGGSAMMLGPEVGVNTREAAKDISRVLSRMTDVIMARLFAHDDIIQLAENATVPVINGLTDYNHPCQIMADALTVYEIRGSMEGAKVVYIGDGNNIVHSWLELAAVTPIDFTCCCPEGFLPDAQLFERVKSIGISHVNISHDPREAVKGAEFVYTDVWASMGQKEEITERERAFQGFQVTDELIKASGVRNTKFMHCLPAERGRECTDEVMEAPYSIVFPQAENRMHAQAAIMLHCMDRKEFL